VTQSSAFDDLYAANEHFTEQFTDGGLPARAARGLAVITCMDSRLDPFGILGLGPGDAKILRNAGARVTEDVLRTLVLAVYLLGVERVLVMPHTRCRMVGATESEIHQYINERYGLDTRSLEFRTATDQEQALKSDLTRIRAFPLLPASLQVGGAIIDVATGRLQQLVAADN
jgi:carbonic anhydrase